MSWNGSDDRAAAIHVDFRRDAIGDLVSYGLIGLRACNYLQQTLFCSNNRWQVVHSQP
jgi:hypothetical protein